MMTSPPIASCTISSDKALWDPMLSLLEVVPDCTAVSYSSVFSCPCLPEGTFSSFSLVALSDLSLLYNIYKMKLNDSQVRGCKK